VAAASRWAVARMVFFFPDYKSERRVRSNILLTLVFLV